MKNLIELFGVGFSEDGGLVAETVVGRDEVVACSPTLACHAD